MALHARTRTHTSRNTLRCLMAHMALHARTRTHTMQSRFLLSSVKSPTFKPLSGQVPDLFGHYRGTLTTLPRYRTDTTAVLSQHYRGARTPFCRPLTDESRKCNYAVTRARRRGCILSRYHRVTFVCRRDRKFCSFWKSHYICIVKTTTNLMIRYTAHDYFRACRLKRMK